MAGLRGPLTLLSAPAGYGKTTLFMEWRAGCGSEIPLAWFSPDDADNDATLFLAYIIAAIGVVRKNFGQVTLSLLQTPQPPPMQAILTSMIREIGAIDKPFVLAIDDYHTIHHQPIHNVMSFLIEHLPSQMHLVILSREDPPLPLARLRARNQMVEIRENDLRFTHEEAFSFLDKIMGLHLSSKDMTALQLRTEGWITGLQLAALSLQRNENPSHFISTFGGGYHYIVDYLVEEVLNHQSDAVREFLLRTSILERMTGPLCEAVTGYPGGQAMLEYLEKANLFVTPIGDECCWYRYHRLFADVMQNRLCQKYPTQLSGLHTNAAHWYEANGYISEAFRHALAAKDIDLAALLIEQNAKAMIMRGELVALINWSKATGKAACKRPWVCIYQAWAYILTGQSEEGEECIKEAEKYLESASYTENQIDRIIWGYIGAIRAQIALFRGDTQLAINLCEQALVDLGETDPALRSGTAFFLGVARLISGDFTQINTAWLDAVRLGKKSNSMLIATSALDGMTYLATVRGELHNVENICEEMMQLSMSSSGQQLPFATYAYARRAALLFEWNDLDQALSDALKSAELSRILARPNYIIQSHIVLSRVYLARKNLDGALALLSEAEQIGEQYTLTLFADSLLAQMKMRVWAAKGDFYASEELAKERSLEFGKKFNHNRESEYLMLVRICLSQGRNREASDLQKMILKEFELFGWQGRVIETLVLGAMVSHAEGNLPIALDELKKALSMAEPEGYIRIFLDEGAPMRELLRHAGSRGIAPKYVARLLGEFEKEMGNSYARHQPLIAPLTQREIEVLVLLAGGLSNQQIAEKLILSIGTIKTHTASIYRKLDVTRRTEAIARSKDLGLL